MDEIVPKNHTVLWLRGAFPRSYLARTHTESAEWLWGFIYMKGDGDAFYPRKLDVALRDSCTGVIFSPHGMLVSFVQAPKKAGRVRKDTTKVI
jgi:hypothetical protein